MVEEMLAARGICVSYETVRQWAIKFGETFSGQIRQRAPSRGDKWHLDEVAISIAGQPYWLWRAVDQNGFVLDVLVQRRRDSHAARRLMTKLLKAAVTPPRVMITDKLRSYASARRKMGLRVDHRQHKGFTWGGLGQGAYGQMPFGRFPYPRSEPDCTTWAFPRQIKLTFGRRS